MQIIRWIAFLLILLATCFPCAAQQSAKTVRQNAPDAIVADLYKRDLGDRDPFFPKQDRALVRRYIAGALAALIWKNEVFVAGHEDLVPPLASDPRYDSMDRDIKNLKIHGPRYGSGRAYVVVSYKNYGKKSHVVFVLVRRGLAWKVANIKYPDGSTLVGDLAHAFAGEYRESGTKP
jgi:hypothetical protein